jgi:hypothetical protein
MKGYGGMKMKMKMMGGKGKAKPASGVPEVRAGKSGVVAGNASGGMNPQKKMPKKM